MSTTISNLTPAPVRRGGGVVDGRRDGGGVRRIYHLSSRLTAPPLSARLCACLRIGETLARLGAVARPMTAVPSSASATPPRRVPLQQGVGPLVGRVLLHAHPVEKASQRPKLPDPRRDAHALRRGGMSLRLRAEDPQTVASERGTSLGMPSEHYAYAIADLRRQGPRPPPTSSGTQHALDKWIVSHNSSKPYPLRTTTRARASGQNPSPHGSPLLEEAPRREPPARRATRQAQWLASER
jgi:hypothetical protein